MEYLSNDVRKVFRFMGESNKGNIVDYVNLVSDRKYTDLDIYSLVNINRELKFLDKDFIKVMYSGYNYRHINSALRDNWNYEKNGHINLKAGYLEKGKKISNIIASNPVSFGNFKAYRGVNVSYFKKYGIYNVEDLIKLEGQFLLDRGFVSTSLFKHKCFFQKDNDLGIDYNVLITYLIPEEFDDGIFMDGDLAYNPEQYEYLINIFNLAKVFKVEILNDGTANLTVVIIPKRVYDPYYEKCIGRLK